MGLIPHHGGAYFYGSAAQLVDADNNGGLAIDGNQFTLKPGQGALDDPHFLAGMEPGGVERYRLVGEIEHEPEPVHLFFGNLGGGMFAPQHQVAEHGGVGEDGTLFNAIHVSAGHLVEPLLIVEVPPHCLLDPLLELERRLPAKLILQLGGVDGVSQVVPCPVGNVGDQLLRFALLAPQQPVHRPDQHLDQVARWMTLSIAYVSNTRCNFLFSQNC